MKYKLTTKHAKHSSFLNTTSNIITDAGNDLLKLISYAQDEIINKNINDVFFNLLKLPGNTFEQIYLKDKTEAFLFTKTLEARDVTISVLQSTNTYEKTYFIIEKPHSRLEKKFPYLELSSLKNVSAIAIYSADLILLKANQIYLNLLDKPFNIKENSIGLSIFQVLQALKGTDSESHWKQIIKTGESLNVIEFAYEKINGSVTYWDASCVPIFENDRIKYLVHSASEVTEKVIYRKRIEQQNREIQLQKEHLETIMNNVSDLLFLIDANGDFLHINKTGEEFLKPIKPGKYNDLFNNYKGLDMDGNEISYSDLPTIKALKGENIHNEKICIVSNGIQKYLNISATPVFDINNSLIEVVTLARDITYQVQMEKLQKANQLRLVELEKDKNEILQKAIKIKDEFLSIISHEFKTPITVINSAIQAIELLCKDELSDKAKGFLNKIRQNSNRQLKLANNLLDITRVNTGHLKIYKTDIDIVQLTRSITESIKIFAEQKNIRLSFSSTLGKKVIRVDEEKYERILLNLLSNAIKFTPEGKSISVKVSQKIIKKKYNMCIQVRDHGVGIPNDKRELIFEKFGQVDSSLTRQAEGTGIGLHLVKMLIELLGGVITLESKEGVGSTFTVILPIEKAKVIPIEETIKKQTNDRLIQSAVIEFSDVF